jgi:ADP-heptose:LPS heptosyltransferase
VTEAAAVAVAHRLADAGLEDKAFAVVHPAAAFSTKQWATENFGRVIAELTAQPLPTIVITGPKETALVSQLQSMSAAPLTAFTNLTLPEVSALLARARLFVGNDSGIAHIAAAVQTPSVVIFGSSNRAHWGPWATKPAEMVFDELDCQPCHGYYCEKFEQPECIKGVAVERVTAAIQRIMAESQ